MRRLLLLVGALLWAAGPGCEVADRPGEDGGGGDECRQVPVADRIGVAEDEIDDLCDFGAEDEPEPGTSRFSLMAASSCEDLEAPIRDRITRGMRRQVEQACRNTLRRTCEEGDCSWADGDVDADADGDMDMDADGDADEYSTTNVQEAGVDEADFIKNDGSHIYILADDQFVVLQAWPADELSEVSRTTIEGTPQEMFIYGDEAVIYSYDPSDRCYDTYNYGFGGCVTADATTLITVLDISDLAEPTLVRRLEVPGVYVESRRIDSAVHTVLASAGRNNPGLGYSISSPCAIRSAEEYRSAWERVVEENESRIASFSGAIRPPVIRDSRYDASGELIEEASLQDDCEGVMMSAHLTGTSFLTVLGLEVGEPDLAFLTSIVGEQGVLYASQEALYVASVENPFAGGDSETTTVHRFAYARPSASIRYDGAGQVPGRVLNQFSMSEYQGHLRMATTVGRLPDPSTSNNLFVLAPSEGALDVVGELTGVAPTEDIRSARFVRDRGFMVTFKKTDPLFTFDLSDPTSPYVVGELHIPGYSTYMHMVDDDHILSIGFDAEDQDYFAFFQGVMLQLFDVSDMSAPELMHRHVIGTRGTTSEATADHMAFNYFPPREALAIPMGICEESSGGGTYGDVMTFNGLMVFDVSLTDGIEEHGRVAHPFGGDPETMCGNWWTEPASWVRRSVFMEDFVYSVAPDRIIVANLADLSTPIAEVELPHYDPSDW